MPGEAIEFSRAHYRRALFLFFSGKTFGVSAAPLMRLRPRRRPCPPRARTMETAVHPRNFSCQRRSTEMPLLHPKPNIKDRRVVAAYRRHYALVKETIAKP